uniref:Uncharacterized protein n=1 Tax=Ciona intestinalis TaxID=7719 RepID=H2XQ13_CIOIN
MINRPIINMIPINTWLPPFKHGCIRLGILWNHQGYILCLFIKHYIQINQLLYLCI